MGQLEPGRKWMVAEVGEWEGRWELIDGVPYNMTPAPTPQHQQIVGELFFELRSTFGKDGCTIYVSPFDIRLDETDNYTIIQPDLSIYGNPDQVGDKMGVGPPELIIEVMSPSTALKDRSDKFSLYERSGVAEYWIVDPHHQTVEVYGLSEGNYQKRKVFGDKDELFSFFFPEIKIDLEKIFQS